MDDTTTTTDPAANDVADTTSTDQQQQQYQQQQAAIEQVQQAFASAGIPAAALFAASTAPGGGMPPPFSMAAMMGAGGGPPPPMGFPLTFPQGHAPHHPHHHPGMGAMLSGMFGDPGSAADAAMAQLAAFGNSSSSSNPAAAAAAAVTDGTSSESGGGAGGASGSKKKNKRGRGKEGDDDDDANKNGSSKGGSNKKKPMPSSSSFGAAITALNTKAAAAAAAAGSPQHKHKHTPPPPLDEAGWQRNVLDRFPRCQAVEGIRETSYFVKGKGLALANAANHAGAAGAGGRHGGAAAMAAAARMGAAATAAQSSSGRHLGCLRRLLQELNGLEYGDENLLPTNPAIWLRYDEEQPQYLRCVVTGPSATPYEAGLFVFDLYVPDSYPQVPPKVQLLTTGGGAVTFSPNLYADGKVCLSLLNTWDGPQWNPSHSSLFQILISIQGLILGVEHPYYLEPGSGGWEGRVKASGNGSALYIPPNVKMYEDRIRDGTIKYAVMDLCKQVLNTSSSSSSSSTSNGSDKKKGKKCLSYLSPFEDIIASHFWYYKDIILANAKMNWVPIAHTIHQKRAMGSTVSALELVLKQLKAPAATAPSKASSSSPGVASAASGKKKAATKRGRSSKGGRGGDDDNESPESAAKRREMQAAVDAGDYITAGRLQAELELSGKVHDKIVTKTKAMEEAAAANDYVTAGALQAVVRHLEQNKQRLQDLERRMFESAATHDFAKAGRFQEQYRILLESVDDMATTTVSAGSGAAKAGHSSSMWGGPAGALGVPKFYMAGPSCPAYAPPKAAGYDYDDYGDEYYGDY